MPVERSFRGISVRIAVKYLESLGGQRADGDGEPVEIAGDGWRARLTSETVGVGPTVQLTQVNVTFEGEDIDELVETFARKARRAGG